MKEKRTYTNLKEHGEDMSHENEVTIKNEDRGPGDLTFLIEQHKKEIWEQNKLGRLIYTYRKCSDRIHGWKNFWVQWRKRRYLGT